MRPKGSPLYLLGPSMWRRSFLSFALAGAGCAATSEFMTELAVPRSPAPVSDRATVVFIRPSSYAVSLVVTIVDAQGRFLGDALPSSFFVSRVEPGEHTFIGWAENTSALRASVEAGKIYFVEVDVKLGALSPRAHLKALTPESERWAERESWLSDAHELEVDEASGQAYLETRSEDVEALVRVARRTLEAYSPAELAERTLSPNDGIRP